MGRVYRDAITGLPATPLQKRRDKVARQALRDKASWRPVAFQSGCRQKSESTWGALKRRHFPLEAVLIRERWCAAYVCRRWNASGFRHLVSLRAGTPNGLARDMQDGIGLVRVLLQIGDGLCCRQDDQFDLPTPGLELHLFHYR